MELHVEVRNEYETKKNLRMYRKRYQREEENDKLNDKQTDLMTTTTTCSTVFVPTLKLRKMHTKYRITSESFESSRAHYGKYIRITRKW